MNRKLKIKISIDIIMTIFMLLEMAYQLTGNLFHEIAGVTLFGLFFVHNILNIKWYKSFNKGKYNFRRIISAVINLLLLTVMIILMITGIMISRDVFAFLGLNGGLTVQQLHSCAAAWGLVFMSIHVGIHWQMLINMIVKITRKSHKNIIVTSAKYIIVVGIVICGIKASFDLHIGSKLLMEAAFSYWNFEESTIGFFLAYLSIMGIYVVSTYYLLILINKFHKQK